MRCVPSAACSPEVKSFWKTTFFFLLKGAAVSSFHARSQEWAGLVPPYASRVDLAQVEVPGSVIPPSVLSFYPSLTKRSGGLKLMITNVDSLLSGCSPHPHKGQKSTVKFLIAV